MGFADDDDYKVTGYQEGRSKGAILRRQVRQLEDALRKKNLTLVESERLRVAAEERAEQMRAGWAKDVIVRDALAAKLEKVKKYMQHTWKCPKSAMIDQEELCTCGLDNLLAKLGARP